MPQTVLITGESSRIGRAAAHNVRNDAQIPAALAAANECFEDRVMVRNRLQGTHVGDFGIWKASGRRIDITVFHLYHVRDGRLCAHCELADLPALYAQIGGDANATEKGDVHA